MYEFLSKLEEIIAQRKKDLPQGSYTTKLFQGGKDRILQKIGEEACEIIIAGKNEDHKEIKNETADLLFHLLVFLHQQNLSFTDILKILEERHK